MKIDEIKFFFKKIPLQGWILILIVAAGIFLRMYHFRDWLVFSPDQVRDIGIVSDVLNGKSSWIIPGPQIGNTALKLGSWFYHLEIISAKIFGNAPDKMAYPDLFFSILSIPLFYFFLKKYFSSGLSLALSGLYSISFFAVRYSRFAWNPNSIPFFVVLFLLGLLYLAERDKKKSYWWGAAAAGIGLGVGVQLHVLLIFIMPVVTFLTFLHLFLKKYPIQPLIKKAGVMILLVLVTNVGQIAYESSHNFWNTRKFLKISMKTTEKDEKKGSLPMNIFFQSQSNLHVISSLGDMKNSNFYAVYQEFVENKYFFSDPEKRKSIMLVFFSIIYTLSGYFFLAYFWKKETEERKKNFLALVGVYAIASAVAIVPVIVEAELRYYIISFFLPFVFLGLLAGPMWQSKKIWLNIGAVLIFLGLAWTNVLQEAGAAGQFFSQSANDVKNSYFGETKNMADFLIANAKGSKPVFLKGNSAYFTRYFKPIGYFVERSGIDLKNGKINDWDPDSGEPLFFVAKTNSARYWIGGKIKNYKIKDMKIFGNVTILLAGK
jgi:hypothetical protein